MAAPELTPEQQEQKQRIFNNNRDLMRLKVDIFAALAARAPVNKPALAVAQEAAEVFQKFLKEL